MKYKECCRTCLGISKDMRPINSVVIIAGTEIRLTEILENFYDYKVTTQDPLYPENICINCVHQLTITYSFKNLVESSLNKLANVGNENENHSDNEIGNHSYHEIENHSDNEIKNHSDNDIISNYESDGEPKVKPKNNSKVKLRKQKFKPMNIQKDETKILYCVECKGEFESETLLRDHCHRNHTIKCSIGRDCEFCDEKFEDFRSWVLHRKLHLKPLLCEHCWEGFFTDDELKSHVCQQSLFRDRKKPDKVLHQCDQCGKSYPPGYIKIHMLTHSSESLYSCKYCPKKFKVPGGLHSHVQWNHKRVRNYKCEICNATFISSSSRSSHIRKNHLKEKKYGCGCGKRFFSKSELQRHLLTHTGLKNFHCDMCDKSYQTRYGLNCHLKSHYT